MSNEQKNDCALLIGEKEEHSQQYEGKKLSKWILSTLIALLLMLSVIVVCFLITVYVKTDQLQGFYGELVKEQSHNELKNSITRNQMMGIPSDFEDLSEIHNMAMDRVLSVRGIRPHITYSNDQQQSAPIRNWKLNDDDTNNLYFTLIDQSTITIEKSGLYTIAVQLSWRKQDGLALFRVLNSENILTQCVSAFSEKYSTLQTCFTSITTFLKKGDKLSVDINSDTVTVDFTNGLSFLQLYILAEESL